MQSPRMEQMLDRHAVERLSMEMRHANDWLEHYTNIEPNETLRKAWENTLAYRIKLLKAAEEHATSNLYSALRTTDGASTA